MAVNQSTFTLKQLASLEKAIADGVLIVKYSDKMVTYRSLDEMIRTRDIMRRELGLIQKTTRLHANFSKGF